MRTNKKLWIIVIGFAVAIIVVAATLLTQGSHYTLRTGIFAETSNTEVLLEKEGIVEVESIRMDNGERVIDFKALQQGKTNVGLHYHHDGKEVLYKSSYALSVIPFNIIVECTVSATNFSGYITVVNVFVCLMLLTTCVMDWSFFDYRRHGEFGYKMIVCGGVGIYSGVLWLFILYKLLNNWVHNFAHFMQEVSETGKIVFLVLMPAMFVLSFGLSLSNIQLIRKEGRRPVNTLGIVFGILWALATVAILGYSPDIFSWILGHAASAFVRITFIYIIDYFECMFLSTVACAFLSARYLPPYDRDYIIILGCGINRDGTLTPLLKGRVDSAIRFAGAQAEQSGKHPVFVPSGGQGADEVISESEAMANYLQSQNIPTERILKEDKSTNTFENMLFSKQVIENHGGDISQKKVAFATTNYHILRGYILSKKNGYDAKGISANTKLYFYPNAFLREFIGLLADQKWKHVAMILLIGGAFLGYTILSFQ